jgi:hypothetical protein
MTMLLLAALLAGPVAQTSGPSTTIQPRLFHGPGGKPIVPVFAAANEAKPFKPQPAVKIGPPKAPAFVSKADEGREIICGTIVTKKSPKMDPGILLPPHETGAAARRIEPDACRAK